MMKKSVLIVCILLNSLHVQALPIPKAVECDGGSCPIDIINWQSTNHKMFKKYDKKGCETKSENISVGDNSTITNTVTICGTDINEEMRTCVEPICNLSDRVLKNLE